MSLSEELQKLQTLRESGALTELEFAEAKSKVLRAEHAAPPPPAATTPPNPSPSGFAGGPPPAAAQQPTPPGAGTSALDKFRRSRTDVLAGGVCSGLSKVTQVPTWVWRLGFVVLTLGWGFGLVAYVAMWAFVPQEPESATGSPS